MPSKKDIIKEDMNSGGTKMKLSIITPEGNLEDFAPLGDMHLLIANFIEPKSKYTKFYKERNEYIILDTGAFETGVSMPTEELIKRAVLVQADEVASPDVVYNWKETYHNAIDFVDATADYTFRRMAIPQASNIKDWFRCLEHLMGIDGVDVIGLSILSIPQCFKKETGVDTIMENRLLCTQMMEREGLFFDEYEYHLLGLGNPLELMYQKQIKHIRSCDTSGPVVHGMHGVRYDPYLGLIQPKIKEKLDFKTTIEKKYYNDILHNIAILQKMAKR